jgi:hypothetical protein
MFDPRPLTEYSEDDVRRLRPLVHREMTKVFPDSVFVKTHNALLKDAADHPVITLDVTAGALYMVRNPLDVVISYSHHLAKPIEEVIEIMASPLATSGGDASNVYELLASWSEHVASWSARPHPSLHVVRYEDMLTAPYTTFGGVARFLGIDPPRARLDKAIKLSSFKVLQAQEKRKGFIERPKHADSFFRAGKADQWRKVLTDRQVDAIIATHRDQMERFGYLPSGK